MVASQVVNSGLLLQISRLSHPGCGVLGDPVATENTLLLVVEQAGRVLSNKTNTVLYSWYGTIVLYTACTSFWFLHVYYYAVTKILNDTL
jgi:hypothetical protein